MLKSFCILLLCVVSVFAVLEEKRVAFQWAGISSLYNSSKTGVKEAPLIIDGDENNYQASSLVDQQPFIVLTLLNYPVYVTYVDIINRKDCCQDRIAPFTVFLGGGVNLQNSSADALKLTDSYSIWREVDGVASSYRVTFPNTLSIAARVQQLRHDYLNLAEIYVVQLYRPPYTGVAASSVYQNTPFSRAIDGDTKTWFATDKESDSDPWVEVYFPSQKICRVIIWNRYEACCYNRIDPFVIALKNGNFTVRTPNPNLTSDYCNNEAGISCSPAQNGGLEYYTIDFANEPVADRMRLFQQNGDYLNIADIQVYACSFPANFSYRY